MRCRLKPALGPERVATDVLGGDEQLDAAATWCPDIELPVAWVRRLRDVAPERLELAGDRAFPVCDQLAYWSCPKIGKRFCLARDPALTDVAAFRPMGHSPMMF
jgi:hypothetical protein